jgi:hypothetical protein
MRTNLGMLLAFFCGTLATEGLTGTGILAKPFDRQQLVDAVSRALEKEARIRSL